ncbi:MAG: alpha/beta hydrolase domain-containing protein [Chitinophagaceae bacterium]
MTKYFSSYAILHLLVGVCFTSPVAAGIIRIEISSIESPTFGGKIFGNIGTYEKLRGRAYGEVDPNDLHNSIITDVGLAPRNANGMVEYSMDIYILKPVNLSQGNHKLFFEVNNRGGKLFGGFNNSEGGNDPSTAADAGDAFLMNQGYSIAWCGWDISAAGGNNNLTITVPVAKQHDGSLITGPSYEYIAFDNSSTLAYSLAYPAASINKAEATLTMRMRLGDTATVISAGRWDYVNDRMIHLLPAGTCFTQSAIYEFRYTAKDPLVAGLGLAATRDFISFLRYSKADNFGHPNPLAGDVRFTFSFTLSQPARYLNDFQALGFNEDEQGKRVIDGIENWLGGASGVGINFRFAQPGRTERNRQNHLYPEAIFPFAYPLMTDPLTNKTGGRGRKCSLTNTCPKVFEINSANEYWVKAASLLHTDCKGNDIPDPANVRFFLIAGAQHGTGSANNRGVCQQLQNPTNGEPALRALFIALDEWVTLDKTPPESNVPRNSAGTAVLALPKAGSLTGNVPQKALGWPIIPGVVYNGLITTRYFADFGNLLSKGIVSHFPTNVSGRPVYPNFVSRVDKDGNEVAGILLPPVAAAIATTTGWALRREGFGENDGCEGAGQFIPFKITKAERLAAKDPRLSLEERYQTHDNYVKAVTDAARKLQSQRLLLEKDVRKYIEAAEASDVLR